MNNSQFRALLFDKSASPSANRGTPNDSSSIPQSSAPSVPDPKRLVLGSRTSRRPDNANSHQSFAQTAREQYGAFNSRGTKPPPSKKFKSSAPKGSKFGAGYTDRAKARAEAGDDGDQADDKAKRIRALEEQVLLGNLERSTFEQLRDEITKGDVESTHLVKGLDWKLLERVRAGEDVLSMNTKDGETAEPQDIEAALDEALLHEQDPLAKSKSATDKRGQTAAAAAAEAGIATGKKRTRDEIMAELKAQRRAAAEARVQAEKAALDSRWTRVGGTDSTQQPKHRIEIDAKGREVLITVDEDGVVKRKVRKVRNDGDNSGTGREEAKHVLGVDILDVKKPVLGSDAIIPSLANDQAKDAVGVEKEGDDDDDIFAGAGTEYNPLGDDEDDESSGDEEKAGSDTASHKVTAERQQHHPRDDDSSDPAPIETDTNNIAPIPATTVSATTTSATAPRNYFSKATDSALETPSSPSRLHSLQQIISKAASLADKQSQSHATADDAADSEAAAARAKRAKLLASQNDRDFDDLDLGFGSSRFEDEGDEGGGGKGAIAEWDGEENEGKAKAKGSRRERARKRKGDKNSIKDVLGVVERRKAAGGDG